MNIQYKYISVNNPEGKNLETPLEDFLLKTPSLGMAVKYTKKMPPLTILNDFLVSGSLDCGMSGIFEWNKFEISNSQYTNLLIKLSIKLDSDVVTFCDKCSCLNEWQTKVQQMK